MSNLSHNVMPPFDEQVAGAVGAVAGTQKIPDGFYQRPDGIVAPERLRNPIPQLTISGSVNNEMFQTTSESIQRIEGANTIISGLEVNFLSRGGDITSGFGIYDLLTVFGRKHNVPVTITGYGPVMSMGVFILQAGDIRRMPKNSIMLLHPPSISVEDDIRKAKQEILAAEARERMYAQIVSDRVRKSGKQMSPEDVTRLCEANNRNGTYLSAEQALDLGLIDEII